MIAETQGVVFNYIKYKETSIIVRVFTQKYGLKSFLVNGIRSKKAKRSIGLFQPFTLLEIQLYYHEDRELLRLSDAKISRATPNLSQNVVKGSLALFISEVLSKTLTHEHHDNELFVFIRDAVIMLDSMKTNIEDFHLLFLIKYSGLLGLDLVSADLIEGVQLSTEEVAYLNQLISYSFEDLSNANRQLTTGASRKECLEALLSYFSQHLGGTQDIKSLRVLHQIFH